MGFKYNFNNKKPKTPAVKEAIKITNFELLMIVWSSKARSVIKIDIVNPIPPKSPTPKMDFQLSLFGSLQSPIDTAINVKRKMPNGLPTMRPSAIPKL